MASERILKLGLPAGSLQKATVELFDRAGLHIGESKRSYWPTVDDEEIQAVYLRAQEMGRYVGDGVLDAGITGLDWIKENGCDVVEVCELPYSKETSNPTKWVLAVPNESAVTRPEEGDPYEGSSSPGHIPGGSTRGTVARRESVPVLRDSLPFNGRSFHRGCR